jgi:hypothetical protein
MFVFVLAQAKIVTSDTIKKMNGKVHLKQVNFCLKLK